MIYLIYLNLSYAFDFNITCFFFTSCEKNNSPIEETPFSFIGTWNYTKKTYQFSEIPFTQESNGVECNGETKFTFRKNEFEITIFEGSLCENRFFYVLPYELSQKNDSTHVLTSDQLLRTNYSPKGQPDFSEIPLNRNQVELIIR